MKAVGTLKEIGAQPGDRVGCPMGEFTISAGDLRTFVSDEYHIVAKAARQIDGEASNSPAEGQVAQPASRYHKIINGVSVDVYDVLTAFGVTNAATAHAVKKLLAAGERGHKDKLTDLNEAMQSIARAVQIEEGRG